METLQDLLEIAKDLLEIFILAHTAYQLLSKKKKKSKKPKKKK